MKKMFISVIALAMSVMAMATEEAFVRIRFNGASGGESVVRLYQDDANTPEYESSFDSDKMLEQSNSKSVLIYGIVGTHKCEDVVTNNLQGVEIGFVTNNVDAANYKFTFENPRGLALQLYDRVEDKLLDMTNNATYTFNAAAGRAEINNRFVIGAPAPVYSVTTNIDGWASYSSDVDLVAPDELTVYAGTIVGEELSLTSVNYIKANEGVIVKGEAGQTYTLTPGSGSDSYTNDLKPSSAWASHNGTIYCLHNEGVGTTAFYQYTGSDMPANKAYLQISTTPSSAPKRISMRFNQPTAIENVELEAVKAEKFVGEDGQVFIKRGEIIYNVQGQIVK